MSQNKRCPDFLKCVDVRKEKIRQDQGPLVLLVLAFFIVFLPFASLDILPFDSTATGLVVGRDKQGAGVIYTDVTSPANGIGQVSFLDLNDDLNQFPHLAPLFFQPVALNRADIIMLSSVPGIGPKLAERIIKLRRKKGGFLAVQELLEVQGIGPLKFAALQRNFRL